MTNITKAAQDALTDLDWLLAHVSEVSKSLSDGVMINMRARADALRAALQDKAGEVRDARFWLEAIVDIWSDGDKAPEHRCYVEGAFSDAMREASALLAAQPAPVVPEFNSIARRKLDSLQADGWQINGYAIRRGDERGFVDASGFVGWWRGESAPVVPDDVAQDAGWFRLIRDGSGWPAAFAAHDAPEPLRGDDLDAAMIAASQQKGGSAG